MKHNIYNLFPAISLSSGMNIYLQSISLSHPYSGLLCGSPSELINDNILLDIYEEFQEGLYVVEPDITLICENEFFGRCILNQNNLEQIPLIPLVKVHALFECYDGKSNTYLNIVWFQEDFSVTIKNTVENKIKNIDSNQYACEFSL